MENTEHFFRTCWRKWCFRTCWWNYPCQCSIKPHAKSCCQRQGKCCSVCCLDDMSLTPQLMPPPGRWMRPQTFDSLLRSGESGRLLGLAVTKVVARQFLRGKKPDRDVVFAWNILARWWSQIFFIFTPIWGRWTHFDEHIFQMGWFNHQPACHSHWFFHGWFFSYFSQGPKHNNFLEKVQRVVEQDDRPFCSGNSTGGASQKTHCWSESFRQFYNEQWKEVPGWLIHEGD